MIDRAKYTNTMNLGREDANKHGWKLGDIVHVAGTYVTANKYNYCGYDEIEVPKLAKAKIIGVKQTTLNAVHANDGTGDVYVDVELVDVKNADGHPVILGNRHAFTFCEASPDHMICPDGSGDLGCVRDGVWYSYAQKPGTEADYSRPWTEQRAKSIELAEVA